MKYPGVLFMNDGKMENEVDGKIGVGPTVTVIVRKDLSLKGARTLAYGHNLCIVTQRLRL